jgi:hypothetical protein
LCHLKLSTPIVQFGLCGVLLLLPHLLLGLKGLGKPARLLLGSQSLQLYPTVSLSLLSLLLLLLSTECSA